MITTISTKLQTETSDQSDKCTADHPRHRTTSIPTLFELDKSWQFESGGTCIKQTDAELLIIVVVNLILSKYSIQIK